MNDLALSVIVFHESAVKSYIASRLLVSTGYLAPIGFYNAHLAMECILKSVIAEHGCEPRKIHNLVELLHDLDTALGVGSLNDAKIEETLVWLNPYQELGRYGALAREAFDPDRTKNNIIEVRGVIAYQASSDIERIDYTFSKLRSLSDNTDVIDNVINKKHIQQWNLPISIEDVITTQNNYLK